jgi:parallel beta-helix repeat protein
VVSGSGIKIVGCDVVSAQGTGIQIDAGGPIIDSCMITSCAVGVNSQSDATSLIGCWITGSSSYGLVLAGNNCRVVGCHVATNGSGGTSGILVQGSYSIVSDCYIGDNTRHGIEVSSGDYNIIRGCMVFENSQGSAGTYDGIELSSSADANIVTGNLVRGITDHAYGIDCQSVTNYVFGNYLLGGGASGALNGTVKTSWGSNQVYDGVSAHTAIVGSMVNVTA